MGDNRGGLQVPVSAMNALAKFNNLAPEFKTSRRTYDRPGSEGWLRSFHMLPSYIDRSNQIRHGIRLASNRQSNGITIEVAS